MQDSPARHFQDKYRFRDVLSGSDLCAVVEDLQARQAGQEADQVGSRSGLAFTNLLLGDVMTAVGNP